MKNMKYVLLFEAFKSSKLSKTLGFIKDPDTRDRFLNNIKRVTSAFDFPTSELSDDMFQYLPFKAALKVNKRLEEKSPVKCDAESEWIPGEFCDEGKIKRTWGKGYRTVECEKCGGTGIKKVVKDKPEVYCLKFWFDKDGKFITITGSDGTKREDTDHDSNISRDLNDYIEKESYESRQVNGSPLKTGDIVKSRINHRDVIGTFFRKDGSCFIVGRRSDGLAGGRPNGTEWKVYGDGGWGLGSNDHGPVTLLEPKSVKESELKNEVEDPYTWNYRADIGRYGSGSSIISLSKNQKINDYLKDAHFAIILYMDKLTSSDFTKGRDIKATRDISKEGSLKLETDEDIKNANIERYINKLSDSFDISSGISGITKVIPRLLGGKNNIFYYLNDERRFSSLNDIITLIYDFMKDNSKAERSTARIKYILNNDFKGNIKLNNNISENKSKIIEKLKSDTDYSYLIPAIEALDSLNEKVYNKINVNIETIQDIEILYSKLVSIRQIIRKDRYSIRNFSNYLSYLSERGYSNSYNYLVRYTNEDKVKDLLDDVKIISDIIDKI